VYCPISANFSCLVQKEAKEKAEAEEKAKKEREEKESKDATVRIVLSHE